MQLDKKNKKRKVHFLVPYSLNLVPGQRFRFEQYLQYWTNESYKISVFPFIDKKTYEVLYSRNSGSKIWGVLRSYFRRIIYLLKVHKADCIYIFRETNPFGGAYYEKILKKISKAQLFFDFDDSIWLEDKNEANKNLSFLKRPSKISAIISICDTIIAGNNYLAEYAKQYNKNVIIIPTTINTDWYKPKSKSDNSEIVIGWSGSFTTIKHFESAIEALTKIKSKYGDKVRFKVIGDCNYSHEPLNVIGQKWQSSTEVEDLQSIDIGIMPLPDIEWTRGKCGLKGLQYMGLAIPTIMSPVGVNTDIIEHGINGFLASTMEEWVGYLSKLIESKQLRKKLGEAGRKTVKEKYSVEANKEKYLALFSQ